VTPTSLNFYASKTEMSFDITNSGGSVLKWNAAELPEKNWVTSISPNSGDLSKGNSVAVRITIDRTDLALGNYIGVVNVSSNVGNQYVNIFMTVEPDPPIISVAPTSLNFDNTLNQLTFKVSNIGGDTLIWEAEENPDKPWIASLVPVSGNLEKNEETDITVEVNRYGINTGEYFGKILLKSNDKDVELNVDMTIDSLIYYEQRVNCGSGNAYVDGESNTWQADQAYVSGSWGYAHGYTNSTTSEIANTTDDQLFQYERNNVKNYKFDVPNGTYDVFLMFAEIYYNAAGYRQFNVAIENTLALVDFDVFAEAGRNAALGKKFTCDVEDGQLNIDFITTGEEPSISAIHVITSGVITQIDDLGDGSRNQRNDIPESYKLHQNYPNPFKSLTTVAYDIPFNATIKIVVFNMLGQKVNEIQHGSVSAGIRSFTLNAFDSKGTPLPSGVYVYQIEAMSTLNTEKRAFIIAKKMVVKK
jgi:hypothetical protein